MLNLPGLKRVQIPVNGGVDEISAVDSLAPEDAILMHNFRLSPDGKRIEKRLGLSDESSGFTSDVYGYTTYFDTYTPPRFCQVAVLEGGIYTKVASGAWTNKYSFGSNLAHPTNIIEAQRKKFVITDVGSRLIMDDSNSDPVCYQIGISAPTTIPTAAVQYTTQEVEKINDSFASLASWTDDDTGTGTSSFSSTDPDSTPGPEADSGYLHNTVTWAGGMASRYYDVANIGTKYTLEFSFYIDVATSGHASYVKVYNGSSLLNVKIADGFVYIVDGHLSEKAVASINSDTWNTIKFSIDASNSASVTGTCIHNGGSGIDIPGFYAEDVSYSGRVYIQLDFNPGGGGGSNPVVYWDYIKLYNIEYSTNVLEGTHMYTVTYVRGGNYGCESNATKSAIGSVTFIGTGLNDLTVSGTYANTASVDVFIRMASVSPDTVQISYDHGGSWSSKLAISSTMYLNYGLILNWGATSGHTQTDYWYFTGQVCSASPTQQEVYLTNIPCYPTNTSDTQITARKIYRTTAGGSQFFYLATINDATSTTFTDNIPDTMLGELLEEDHYVCPNGKFSCYWDDRLWVFDHEECVGYYSRTGEPEHFDTTNGWVAIRRGIPGDNITGVIPYKDSIYVFKPNAIFAIQKNNVLYGVFQVNNDVGCISPGTLVEVNDYLMFRSYRGIEVYDGANTYNFDFSMPVHRTLHTIINTYNDLHCAAHNKYYNEVWFTFNDRTEGVEITVVWNYLKNKWYTFGFSTAPSYLAVCRDSTKKNVLKMCTKYGGIYLCDTGYMDGTELIAASYRKGWLDIEKHGNLRRVDVEYELEAGKTITTNIYVDMDKDVFRTYPLTGVTPSSTNQEYRRPIIEKIEVGGRAKWFAVEFLNSEQLTAPLKINDCYMYVRQDVHKNKKYAD